MKKNDLVVKDYVSRLPFDTLKFLTERLRGRIGSDIAEVVDVFSKSPELDRMLAATKDADEFFNTVDFIASFVEREYGRRHPDLVDA
jgi:hypothetical protein